MVFSSLSSTNAKQENDSHEGEDDEERREKTPGKTRTETLIIPLTLALALALTRTRTVWNDVTDCFFPHRLGRCGGPWMDSPTCSTVEGHSVDGIAH